MADPEIGAGDGLHHVGEILAAHLRLRAGEHLVRVDHRARDLLDHPRLFFLVHQHAEGVADVGIDLALEGRRHAGADRAHPLADQRAHAVVEGADGAAQLGFARNDIVGGAGMDLGDRQHRRVMRRRRCG